MVRRMPFPLGRDTHGLLPWKRDGEKRGGAEINRCGTTGDVMQRAFFGSIGSKPRLYFEHANVIELLQYILVKKKKKV